MTTPVLWDCLMYGGGPVEEMLLRLRLDTLAELNDEFSIRHIVTTADVTFSGLPHDPVMPDDLVDRLAALHRVTLADAPSCWHREHAQRDAAFDVLGVGRFMESDDLVLIGDLDEIPHPEAIRRADDVLSRDEDAIVRLVGAAHSFAIDMRCEGTPHHLWETNQPLLATRGRIAAYHDGTPSSFRAAQPVTRASTALGAPLGWHLSSMGGPRAVWSKLAASAHASDREVASLTFDDLVDRWFRRREVLNRCALLGVLPDQLPPGAQDPGGPYASLFLHHIDADLGRPKETA